jgi:hypothetical protein
MTQIPTVTDFNVHQRLTTDTYCIARATSDFVGGPGRTYMAIDLVRLEVGQPFKTWCGEKRVKDGLCPTTFIGVDAALALPTCFTQHPLCPACAEAVREALRVALTGVNTP